MKQTLAFIMATAMLACTLSMTTFAATDIVYPVGDISSRAYVTDDDGDLYLTTAANKVGYGKTAYFPLLSSNTNAVAAAETAWKNAVTAEGIAHKNFTDAQTAYNTANDALEAYKPAKAALDNYNNKITGLDEALSTAEELQGQAQTAHETAQRVLDNEEWKTTEPDSGKWPDLEAAAVKAESDTKNDLDDKNQDVQDAQAAIVALGNLSTLTSNEATKKALMSTATGGATTIDAAETVVDNRKQTMEGLEETWGDATKLVTSTAAALESARTSSYLYVYEQDATKGIKISKKWEESGSYVSDVDVVRKRVRSDINATGSMQYIYFLAIKIKSSSSTQDRDLLGTVTLKKSGSDGFEVSTDIGLEIGYSSASDTDAGEGVITSTPRTFKEGDGFEAEEDCLFEFEDDSDSYFQVNTIGQGSIVLAFNNDFDDDIEEDYPDAILWFFNGNYASFNRVGDLYLSYPDDDGYVYEISKSGDLTRINPDYDEYEEAYHIRTRTLGRYVISDTRLSITSSSSSSSSSSSGSGTGTGTGTGGTGTAVVPTAPSTPSYTYTPPAASSSTAPPAQSSSEPEEEEEEEESEPEELEDEDDDIVEVVVDDQEAEGPEEKSGIPAWVWAMIIVGLAAVPVAIGVVYYLHSRPLRRDFFNKGDDEYDDDYDDDDEE